MKQIILIMILTLICNTIMAEWTKVIEHEDETIYVDIETLRRTGHKVKLWDLRDYNSLQSLGAHTLYLSVKYQSEYECEKELIRGVAGVYYSENMGQGKVESMHTFKENDWVPIIPGSYSEVMWRAVCSKQYLENNN